MQAIDAIRYALNTSLQWAASLAEDLKDQPLAQPTAKGGNHAMWVMGHAACSERGLLGMITGEPSPIAEWDALFGGGTEPKADASQYPAYPEVLRAFKEARAATMRLLDSLAPARLNDKPAHLPDAFAELPDFQTVGRVLLFTAMHQMSHFGQLADVRRSLGRKPLM